MCIQSLMAATDRIRKEKSWLDGQMFLLKHLLILREQTAPFRMNQPVGELALNFGKIKDAAMNLFNHRNLLFSFSSNNALLEFLLQVRIIQYIYIFFFKFKLGRFDPVQQCLCV